MAFALYGALIFWAAQVDFDLYLSSNNTEPRWLDLMFVFQCFSPALPILACLLIAPTSRRNWLWVGFGLIAFVSMFSLWESVNRPGHWLWSTGVSVVILPFFTWPITLIVLLIAWRDHALRLILAPFR